MKYLSNFQDFFIIKRVKLSDVQTSSYCWEEAGPPPALSTLGVA